jgi:hypothetical protein
MSSGRGWRLLPPPKLRTFVPLRSEEGTASLDQRKADKEDQQTDSRWRETETELYVG